MEENTKIITWIILDRKIKIDWNKIDFNQLLIEASKNRLLYVFSKKLSKNQNNIPKKYLKILSKIIQDGDKNFIALKNTLKLLGRTFEKEKIDYLIVKTFKYFDYITFDVDFAVKYKDFKKAIGVLKKNKIIVKPHPNPSSQGLHQRNCFKKGFIKMDLHRKFFWLGIDHIDEDFVWRNTTTRKIADINCPVPSLETDFLLHNKQLVFERRYITLLDFLAIHFAQKEGLNWKKILSQIDKYKWNDSFYNLVKYLNFINKKIFDKNLITKKDINKEIFQINLKKDLKLPLDFGFIDANKVFYEIATKHNKFSSFGFAYYYFSTIRYKINDRMPYYDHWYNFNEIIKNKNIVTAKCIYDE